MKFVSLSQVELDFLRDRVSLTSHTKFAASSYAYEDYDKERRKRRSNKNKASTTGSGVDWYSTLAAVGLTGYLAAKVLATHLRNEQRRQWYANHITSVISNIPNIANISNIANAVGVNKSAAYEDDDDNQNYKHQSNKI